MTQRDDAHSDDLSLPYETFLERARFEAEFKSASHDRTFELGQGSWSADLEAGTITFDCPKVIITSPVQVVGTYNLADGTWLWGWDHPSVSEPLARAAQAAHDYGQLKGIEALTTRKVKCDESDCWDFAAIACKLFDAQGAYRGPAGNALVFMLYTEVVAKPKR